MWLADLTTQEIVGLIGGVAAVVTIVLALSGPVGRLYRWASEPRRLRRALRELRCGVQLQWFTDALGQHPTRRAGPSHLYVLEDVYVNAETDGEGNVIRFAVTVRSPHFKPTLPMGVGGDVTLGETTYAALELDGVAQGLHVMQSPAGRHTAYSESYWFANPGGYQTWVVGSNASGAWSAGDLQPILAALGHTDVANYGAFEVEAPFGGEMPNCWYTRPPIEDFRASTPINTLSTSGVGVAPDPEPGPWIDEARNLTGWFSSSLEREALVRGWLIVALVIFVVVVILVTDAT